MSTEPMGGGPGYTTGQPNQASGPKGGACGVCGRELSPPDLEAVAASIDQTLSLEAGRMVPRTAWAGRPPDGVMDGLFFWLPAIKATRRLWERGQALWTEQMTAALSGPCADCHGTAPPSPASPAPTLFHVPDEAPAQVPDEAPPAASAHVPYEPTDAATTAMPRLPEVGRRPAAQEQGEAMTSAMPAFLENSRENSSAEVSPADAAPTSAVPTFVSSFGGATPADTPPGRPGHESDEHESHTVMLSALPSPRTATRLVVLEGPVHGRQFSLGRERTTIGRSIGCHVTVEADNVAYDHARIVRAGNGWQIEPVGGAAELHVNDEPVRGARVLAAGDVIRIGSAQLRFESAS